MAPYLIPRLQDENLEVRAAAIGAATRMQSPLLIPPLISSLLHATLAHDAALALTGSAETDLATIVAHIADADQPLLTRSALLSILGDVDLASATDMLMGLLQSGSPQLHFPACEALLMHHRRGSSVDAERLRPLLRLEILRGYKWDTAIRLAAWGPRALLLREPLEIRYNETCRRILILLDLMYPELAEERLRPSLLGEASRARAGLLSCSIRYCLTNYAKSSYRCCRQVPLTEGKAPGAPV